MDAWFDIARHLDARLLDAARELGWMDGAFTPEVRTADPRFGDFQANGVLGYAKQTKQNPRALAQALLEAFLRREQPGGAMTLSVAGPGFINFALQPGLLLNWLRAFGDETALGAGAGTRLAGRKYVVDYSSPNTAKHMHVGHLRSAVIGESLCRLLAFCGAEVVRDNHLGDWGTQFGKLIWAYKRHLDTTALEREPLEEFERLYKLGNAAAEADPAILKEAQQELARLQSGDAANRAVWEKINAASRGAFQAIYDRLGLRFDAWLGESFYNDKVAQVYRELIAHDIARESDGALVVFFAPPSRFVAQPFIVRKSDGAANYASTDLATVLYRTEHFHANAVLYVVDSRQRDHFDQLFETVQRWFSATGRTAPELRLVDFGTVLGENGKPLKTRSGDNIRLKELLDEAVERALAVVTAKNPDLPETQRREIAEVVGIGAVQYADLSQNRASDYEFSWSKLLSLEGNTAPYLLYAGVRVASIERKLEPGQDAPATEATPFETPAELALARKLVAFPSALEQAVATLRPHFIANYLYELAGEFSSFYNADRVRVDETPVRARRLLLCRRTALVLQTGLHLLGMRTIDRM